MLEERTIRIISVVNGEPVGEQVDLTVTMFGASFRNKEGALITIPINLLGLVNTIEVETSAVQSQTVVTEGTDRRVADLIVSDAAAPRLRGLA